MRVLISGAGIAGPTLAWWLAKLNHQVTVIDTSKDFLGQGQNIDITGAAVTIAKHMGIESRIKQLNTTEKGTHIIDQHGRILARFDATETGRSPTSPYEILRGDLAMILGDATKTHPNVTYRFGIGVQQILSNDDAAVRVELTNGERHEFDMLVAADGQWSRLRKHYFDPSSVTIVDKNMYAAYFTVPRAPSDTDFWRVYWPLGRRIVTARPDPHGTIRVALTLMPRTSEQKAAWEAAARAGPEAQKRLLRSEFADVGGDAPRFLHGMDDATDFYLQGIKQIRMEKWWTSRVVCLGDAAHAPTPLSGMGTSLAMIGAYVLAGEMSRLDKGQHPREAFEAYEEKFRPFVEKSQRIPAIVPGAFHPATAWQRWLLETIVWLVATVISVPWLARLFSEDKSAEADDGGFPMPIYSSLIDR